MDILKKLSKYFIITLAIMFVCSFVVLVDKFHKIEYNVFDIQDLRTVSHQNLVS